MNSIGQSVQMSDMNQEFVLQCSCSVGCSECPVSKIKDPDIVILGCVDSCDLRHYQWHHVANIVLLGTLKCFAPEAVILHLQVHQNSVISCIITEAWHDNFYIHFINYIICETSVSQKLVQETHDKFDDLQLKTAFQLQENESYKCERSLLLIPSAIVL